MHPLVGAALLVVAVAGLPYAAFLALYALYRPSGSAVEKDPEYEPTVSVVLPTYDEERIVEGKLERLCDLDYPMDRVEIVVVDSSDDATPDRVRAFFADREAPELTLIEEDERRGVASAVNDAIRAADGEVVFRTDCDAELAPDVLREAVATLADERVDAVTGRQADVIGDSDVERDYRDMLARIQSLETRLDSAFIAHGPCFAFRREAFAPIPPDTIADDTSIAVAIRRAGGRVVMDPALRFAESGVSAFGARRKRKDRRALGLVQALVRNRDMLGRYGKYGRAVLPFNWWFMIVSPWLAVLAAALSTAAALSVAGLPGLALPAVGAAAFWLGQRDLLGPLQPLHAVVDAQVSLLVGAVQLVTGDVSGTWEIDRESREAFE
ncbi:MAG TPA: glycosyltransferase [Natronoarchaeum rubrum]|nr:glycosyltransferase [Natronoarchaeum rubrum]